MFRVFTLRVFIVNNNTSHAAARRARWSCIAPPLRALSQQTKSQRSSAPPVTSASVPFHPFIAASWFIFNF
jgi:hypothetical protein